MRLRLFFSLLICLLLPVCAQAAIINTLQGFKDQEPGWTGNFTGSFSTTGGNTEQLTLEAAGQAQLLGDRSRWRFLSGARRESSHGVETAKSVMGHVRHNQTLSPLVHTLAFLQIQQNPFQRLESRFLLGGGFRFDLFRRQNWSLSWGLAHMVEKERIEDEAGSDTDHRVSSFLMVRWRPQENVQLDVIAFAQPRWAEFADLRAIVTAGMRVKISDAFSLRLQVDYQHDANPPANVDEADWEFTTGLSFEL
ncbi:MAG: DUF481 domain-containing protein [bacterium]